MVRRFIKLSGLAVWLLVLVGAVHAAESTSPVAPAPEEVPSVDESHRTPAPAATNAVASSTDGRCDRCGSCASVRRVCVAVPVEREKKKVCWSYRCEQVCIPGPSIFCGESCESDQCGSWWKQWWKPTCAHTITKRVPVKTEVVRKQPGFEWKLQERCCGCNPQCSTPQTSWLSCLLHPFGAK
jgi:hypothetical protein